MKPLFLMFLLLNVLSFVVYALNSDGLALVSLMKHWTSVPPSIISNWSVSDSTPCSWIGIDCSSTHNVIALTLSGYSISGLLGPEIGNLTHLQRLDLQDNFFTGAIPSHLSNCSLLENLDLSQNFFTKEIPYSLQNLRKLNALSLYNNLLIGEIPEWIFQIPGLENLYMDSNKFSGSIPSNVGNSSFSVLWLNTNQLVGTIPESIGNCSDLRELRLDENKLVGFLPRSLYILDKLESLDVINNSLVGEINFGLGNCKKLKKLFLSSNGFSGGLPPGLANCSSLDELFIADNHLTSKIPSSYGLLSNLSKLVLNDNKLSGTIPPELGKCKSLKVLKLMHNQLEGEIPSELGMLSELTNLELYHNNLTGEVPISIWKIQSLEHVLLQENNLSGELPLELAQLKHLNGCILYDNHFFGVIPQSLGVNSNLEVLDLTNNQFTGTIPPNLCFGNHLRALILGDNNFQGSIPVDVGSCPTIWRLRLDNNNLSGVIPEFPENLALSYFNLTGNSITGKIPSSLGNCTNLTAIDFSMNKLSGFIPPELGNLVNLTVTFLAHNHLHGCLPSQLSTCTKLLKLDVGFNSLNCSIPSTLGNWTSLSTLILEENQFTGGIPPFLKELKNLQELRMGGNMLSGEIPSWIGELKNLQYGLNLSNNGLIGSIPSAIGGLFKLVSLDISSNNLTGSLGNLRWMQSLREVNISYNNFIGPIPENLMKLENASLLGNPGLCVKCSISNKMNCSRNGNFTFCDSISKNGKILSRAEIAMIAVGSSLGVILLLGFAFIFLLGRRRKQQELWNTKQADNDDPLLHQIMRATDNLNESYIVGKGGHGAVYKAELSPSNVFAVKKLEFGEQKDGSRSMVREIQILEKIRHRNLVKVENFWFMNDYGLILYKYMENGSLYDVLYEKNPPMELEWSDRYRIAIGAAHGLAYLHYDCDPPILHRDIKPQNILLDSDMEPCISDFGIAKLLDHSTPSTSIAGTVGYIAPEHAFMTAMSKESDVYGYGMVLLELITRKKPLDSSLEEELDFVGWIRSVWSETQEIDSIIDSSLMEEAVDSNVEEQIIGVLVIALRCTEKEPRKRPTMRDVVKQLTDVNNPYRSFKHHSSAHRPLLNSTSANEFDV